MRLWISKQSQICCRGTGFGHSMDSTLSVKNEKFLRRLKGVYENSSNRRKSRKSFVLQFVGIWQILWRMITESSNCDTFTIRNKWHCWKSRTTIERRIFCRIVAIRLGWKMVGWLNRRLLLSAKSPRPPERWENTLWMAIRRTIKGPVFPFGAVVEYPHISAKDQSRIHKFGKKVLPGIFLGYALFAGGNLERIYNGCRHWGAWQFGRVSYPCTKAQRKGSNIAQKERDHGVREATLEQGQLVRGEDLREDFRGNSEKSQPTDEMKDDAEARNVFWSIEGDFVHRHHVEPRVQLYVPKEETFPITLKQIDVTRTTHTNLKVLQESRIDDTKNVDVDRSLSDSRTGFTKFTLPIEKNLQKDICGPGSGLQ